MLGYQVSWDTDSFTTKLRKANIKGQRIMQDQRKHRSPVLQNPHTAVTYRSCLKIISSKRLTRRHLVAQTPLNSVREPAFAAKPWHSRCTPRRPLQSMLAIRAFSRTVESEFLRRHFTQYSHKLMRKKSGKISSILGKRTEESLNAPPEDWYLVAFAGSDDREAEWQLERDILKR